MPEKTGKSTVRQLYFKKFIFFSHTLDAACACFLTSFGRPFANCNDSFAWPSILASPI